MALMHLVLQWREAAGRATPRLTMLTVDHGLRPEAADEARWVTEQARAHGLDAVSLRWETNDKQSRIQADAREARYSLMAGYAHSHGLDALVTAHHLDDQAETLLMRLGRGSGVNGLAGIPKKGQWAGFAVLRPLLDVPKARLVATLKAADISWLEDPSNEDTRFERVRLRQAMAELERLGIGPEALAQSAARLRRASEALETVCDKFLVRHAELCDAGYGRIDRQAFLDAAEDISLRAVARMLQCVGGQVTPPRLAKLEAMVEAIRSGDQKPRTLGGCRVEWKLNDILVLREAGRDGLPGLILKPGESGLWDNRFHVSLEPNEKAPVEVRALGNAGYGEVRARLGSTATLPEHAVDGLVSFWRDEKVLCVPPMGYFEPTGNGHACNARFINREFGSVNC